jgi:prepilin-type N-terminal cleavage/methylation domain-containing protein
MSTTTTSQWRKPLVKNDAGFTLLEVIIAMAIMVLALSSILAIESGSINASARAKQMSVVAMLARNEMIMAEFDLEGKTFDEVEKEKTGQFSAPYSDYSWKRTVKEVNFPPINPAAGATEGGQSSANDQDNSANVETMAKLITNYLSKAMREITISVVWKKSGKEQSFTVATYWVDLNHAFDLSQ